jgi:hypothetical protein
MEVPKIKFVKLSKFATGLVIAVVSIVAAAVADPSPKKRCGSLRLLAAPARMMEIFQCLCNKIRFHK